MYSKIIKKPTINSPSKRVLSAFSLVELLMALLVASLLLAALAPVMTKRTNENVNIKGVGDIYKAPADMQCYAYSDSSPTVDVSINDVYSASFIISSAGGGGAGATSTNKVAQTPIQITGGTTSDTTQEITITEYMTDVKATLVGAGGGGGGSAGYVSKCPEGTVEFAGDSSTKGFCMTKYNVGERENVIQPQNYAYVPYFKGEPTNTAYTMYYAGAINKSSTETDCATSGKFGTYCGYRSRTGDGNSYTSHPEHCTATGYHSCIRTMVQFGAAERSCREFKYVPSNIPAISWGLPDDKQTKYLVDSYLTLQTQITNLQVCTHDMSYVGRGVTACLYIGNCYGSSTDICYPSHIWKTKENGKLAAIAFRSNQAVSAPLPYDNYAFSARCTLEKTNLFKSYSGAGGGSGAYISELDITEWVKKAGINGKIILTAGKGGNGGSKASSNNTKASEGGSGNLSKIIIQKENGDTVYGIRTKGGSGGAIASNITATGSASVNSNVSASKNCEYTTDGINWSETSCTKNILKGSNGEAKWKEKATAGSASISPVTSNASGSGAGGEGGSTTYGYNNKIDATNGANGKGGFVKITYNNEYAAAPGGGGGGGTIAQIKDVQLGRQAECTLTIGKGGKGGEIDNDGLDGGASSVKCNTDTRTFTVPGGKGGKKGSYAVSSTGNGAIPTIGKGGDYGNIKNGQNSAIKDYNSSKKVISEGAGGEDGVYNQTSKISIGGRGGKSGTGTFGGCGGLYIEDDEKKGICKTSNTDLKRMEGKGFKYEETVTPNANELATSFGISGAGGGGGGWERSIGSGKGGNGMNGYVCVYWYNTD